MNINEPILKIVQESQITVPTILISIILAFILGVVTAQVYRKTFRGISYTESFVISIVMLAPITTVVMLTIGSNLARAFGLVGALSIIRFRTVVKDSKDIMTIFMSLVLGLSVGTQNYHIAILATILFSLFVLFLDKIDFGAFSRSAYLLSFSVSHNKLNEKNYKDILERFVGKFELLNISSISSNKKLMELTYKLEGIGAKDRQNLYSELNSIKELKDISLVSSGNFIKY